MPDKSASRSLYLIWLAVLWIGIQFAFYASRFPAPSAQVPVRPALWATQLAKQTGGKWEVWDVSEGEMQIRLACPPQYNTLASYVIDVDLSTGQMRAIVNQFPQPGITCATSHPK